MNNIKFKNSKDKEQLEKIYGFENYKLLLDIIIQISQKYSFKNFIIEAIKIDYDTVNIRIISKEMELKKLNFEVSLNYPFTIAVTSNNNSNVIEEYKATRDCIKQNKIIYLDKTKNRILYKFYNGSKEFRENNQVLKKYIYCFKEGNLTVKIILILNKNLFHSEYDFIKTLFLTENSLQSIEDLYQRITTILKSRETELEIINLETFEKMHVANKKLISFQKNVADGDNKYYLDYEDGNLSIIYNNLDPDKNEDIQNVKKLIK